MKDVKFNLLITSRNNYISFSLDISENGKTVKNLVEKAPGHFQTIKNGYIFNDTFMQEYDIIKAILESNDAEDYLQFLYEVGDYVLYKSCSTAKPVFGVVEAGEFKDNNLLVRLEFNEAYYLNASDINKL